MYKIGELSKLCNISVKTLRYYDAEGLLIPDEIDKFTGYRYYSASKLEDCYRIIALKELGFSLDDIRVQLTTNDNEKITAALNAKLVELQALIETTQTQLRTIETIKNNLTKGESKMFNIIVGATDEVRVAYIRKNYLSKSDALDDIEKIKSNLPKAILGKRKIIINYETEYRETDFDLAVCMEIVGKLPVSCGYEEKTISLGANVASLICKVDELDNAYKAMIKHFDDSNYCKTACAYEIVEHEGKEFLILEWKSGDYSFAGKIHYYVFTRGSVKTTGFAGGFDLYVYDKIPRTIAFIVAKSAIIIRKLLAFFVIA